ncbi:glyoxylase-like metal-dependent hydrolase (beta-lactamase superfamily II) [Paenibacillus anaericanus]|uniref:MBL fold metallo-hydrolase n=1 Tax=Paenibacillus anaericanus TaxID=170367 RepID=UPI0027898C76|nr:MBL fold metallo-hydrolase [Paenibacillus anaericanus]MDQ0088348.1 glyoxylase-like metal-dependent hydrolase (beta-lactamase superfamily II) [Paenibacillus anaericanus]
MSLQLQMLGTGGAFAKKYYNNNGLLYCGNFTLLIDCGITAPLSLHQLGKSLDEIDAILITHIHGDHVGGLEELAFRMKYVVGRKPVLYIADKLVSPLWDNTLRGGMEQDESTSLEDFFEVRLLTEGQSTPLCNDLTVELIQTPHIPGKASYSLYINDEVFYSADMIFQPDLLKHLVYERGCRKIAHEVQLTGKGEVHTTLQELLSLPTEIQEKISLMHYGDEMEMYARETGEMNFLQQHKIYTL